MEYLVGIVFSGLVLFFFLQKRGARALSANGAPADWLQPFVGDQTGEASSRQPVASPKAGSEGVGAPVAAEVPYANVPQDSVLRRHYVAHVRHMIETVTSPQPTESVLRRHYEQLIESELDECLKSDVQMQELVGRYEALRKAG